MIPGAGFFPGLDTTGESFSDFGGGKNGCGFRICFGIGGGFSIGKIAGIPEADRVWQSAFDIDGLVILVGKVWLGRWG
jgi:hypothetical protein